MSSRLDRLFALLDTSSSTMTRSAAAKQFGEVQKLHPHELHLLLNRLLNYLYSVHWETRVAAAEAIRAIVDQVPVWYPVSHTDLLHPNRQHYCFCQSDNCSLIHGKFQLSSFSVQDCLTNEAHLLGSKDVEHDFDDSKINISEKLKKQKERINERLGLDILSKLGMDSTNDLIIAEDIMSCNDSGCGSSSMDSMPLESNEIDVKNDQVSGLSSRERNRAKRKARQQNSAISSTISATKKLKMINVDRLADDYGVPDSTNVWPSTLNQWPLEYFCNKLLVDLFNSNWVVRHGSVMALRELICRHGQSAGKFADLTSEELENHHQIWIEDVIVRILYILTLDRFGDFVSDSVVAPVRETCAQCLATLVPLMQTDKVTKILDILLDLTRQSVWEIRHSGLLGVKYLLAVANMEFAKDLVAKSFIDVYTALSDTVDDVAAIAASTLIPVAEIVANNLPENVDLLLRKLWDLLLDQDDLTAACNSFMDLLSKLISFESVQHMLKNENFVKNVPRLYPFLWHNSTIVRKCTLQTLETLTKKIDIVWEVDILQELLRYVYQSVILEQVEELKLISERIWLNVLCKSDLIILLNAVCPLVNSWLVLAMHPVKYPIDPSLLITSSNKKTTLNDSNLETCSSRVLILQSLKWYIGGNESISLDVRESNAVRSRLIACRMLGALSVYIVKEIQNCASSEKPIECYVNILRVFLNSKSAMQRLVVGLVISEWSQQQITPIILPDSIKCDLNRCLNEFVYFDEIAGSFTSLMQDYRDFIATLRHYKLDNRQSELFNDCGTTVGLSKILKNIGDEARKLIVEAKLRSNITDKLEDRRKNIEQLAIKTNQDQLDYSILSLSMISGAVIMFDILPENLNPVIKPLMKAIKHENCTDMQKVIANFLAKLMQLCKNRDPCPNPKIINNLVIFLCSDRNRTPNLLQTNDGDLYNGIITLRNQQKEAELLAINKRSSKTSDANFNDGIDDELQKNNRNQSYGACVALKTITEKFGDCLVTDLSRLWEFVYLELVQSIDVNNFDLKLLKNQDKNAEKIINNLQVLEVIADSLSKPLQHRIFNDIVPRLCILLSHPYSTVRHMTSRCIASLATLNPVKIMEAIVQNVITNLNANHDEIARQGAVEAIYQIIKSLFVEIVPFIVLLIVPLLGRMSDQNEPVRLLATQSFATLVQLLPLDSNNSSECLRQSFLYEKRNQDRVFVEQLLSPKSIPNFIIPVEISVQLRSYQQAGVNWLAFLNQYKLHGILCDDMGLGKTLQSICILVSDHFHRNQKYDLTKTIDCQPYPSIVVCPATLTSHWFYEIKKFVLSDHLKPFQYVGSPAEREKSRKEYKKYDVIIVSYETLRKDIDFFKKIHWNYCILDEGHVIKNTKTRVSIAVKSLQSNYRLILSGTPIQNNVLELWSLFDFLMPGFLGTEKQFYATFSRPILASRDPKCTKREQELGVLAMNALHRQVLPLVLRRMKEDVLDDLPPKITQDYYCELTPLQQELYEDFSKSSAHQMLQDSIKEVKDVSDKKQPMHGHIFRALHYLQNVCNHPKLVLNSNHPKFEKIMNDLDKKKQNLNQISHSAKLLALNQLLRECNIGDNINSTNSDETKDLPVTNQHRALIFCQSKTMINIIEQDLFRTLMPDISMLRLDGNVPLSERHGIVTKFNNDPSIDVLLLTTQIGGLGLNLTGADTVIFVEHDWNPMKDLQAMDRAHRIGQKKVVNVYRLITRGTLEEKIMGLQKFKMQTANTIITSENESMQTMVTDQLFDLFAFNKETDDKRDESVQKTKSTSIGKILESLPDLWNPNQYDNEYNMDQFLSKMNS